MKQSYMHKDVVEAIEKVVKGNEIQRLADVYKAQVPMPSGGTGTLRVEIWEMDKDYWQIMFYLNNKFLEAGNPAGDAVSEIGVKLSSGIDALIKGMGMDESDFQEGEGGCETSAGAFPPKQ